LPVDPVVVEDAAEFAVVITRWLDEHEPLRT
jgi:hypothetical protein